MTQSYIALSKHHDDLLQRAASKLSDRTDCSNNLAIFFVLKCTLPGCVALADCWLNLSKVFGFFSILRGLLT